ncbi:transporter [Jeotgalibacillus sp. R-1-5s-1]|nr:transporter [Jeotgalibacillus sp. R-1-5s-1]
MPMLLTKLYEAFMIALVIFTITTLWSDQPYNSILNWLVWLVFFVDFMVRFLRSDGKWDYIKKHPFMVIAIIPFDQFFQTARIVRVIYLFRTKTITKHYVKPVIDRLSDASKLMILLVIFGVFMVESIVIWQLNNVIATYEDALIFIFSQLLFFGRRLFEIESGYMYAFVIFNSIIGVILHGLAIQWIFSQFEGRFDKLKKRFFLKEERF